MSLRSRLLPVGLCSALIAGPLATPAAAGPEGPDGGSSTFTFALLGDAPYGDAQRVQWTDCHRANNGSYVPTERLDTIRELFFPRTGRTLGEHPVPVTRQSRVQREHAELCVVINAD
jgi:hypothetical protein